MSSGRRLRWALVGLAGALAVVAAAVLTVWVAGRGGETTLQPARVRPNSLALLDLDGNVLADVALGGRPIRLTFGDGRFWAALPEGGAVVGVDAETRNVRRLRVGVTPYDVAVGGDALWVVDHDAQVLFRVDEETNGIRASQSFRQPAVAVGYGLGSVWVVVASGALFRIDPSTLAVTRTFDAIAVTGENAEPKLAFTDGVVWISSPLSEAAVRVDPATGIVFRRPVPGAAGATATADAVWMGDATGSLRTVAGPTRRVALGATTVDAAASGDSLWAVSYDDRTVSRIDADGSGVRQTVTLPHPPVAVAIGDEAVGVAVQRRPAG